MSCSRGEGTQPVSWEPRIVGPKPAEVRANGSSVDLLRRSYFQYALPGCSLHHCRAAAAQERYPLFQDVLANLKSGITVGLVNLPLSVSLAIACGGTPEMGALSATWAGIVGGLLNGSHFSLVR